MKTSSVRQKRIRYISFVSVMSRLMYVDTSDVSLIGVMGGVTGFACRSTNFLSVILNNHGQADIIILSDMGRYNILTLNPV